MIEVEMVSEQTTNRKEHGVVITDSRFTQSINNYPYAMWYGGDSLHCYERLTDEEESRILKIPTEDQTLHKAAEIYKDFVTEQLAAVARGGDGDV